MSVVIWILAIAALLSVAVFIATYRVPIERSGALLMRQELQKRDIPVAHLPPEFYAECVAFAKNVSMFSGPGAINQRAEFVRAIENLANMAELWRREPSSPMFASHSDKPSTYRILFERYSV
jgi:hypothetical protein